MLHKGKGCRQAACPAQVLTAYLHTWVRLFALMDARVMCMCICRPQIIGACRCTRTVRGNMRAYASAMYMHVGKTVCTYGHVHVGKTVCTYGHVHLHVHNHTHTCDHTHTLVTVLHDTFAGYQDVTTVCPQPVYAYVHVVVHPLCVCTCTCTSIMRMNV